jgi:hypothetical protein
MTLILNKKEPAEVVWVLFIVKTIKEFHFGAGYENA